MSDVQRFRIAQDRPDSGFAAALAEIQAGRKQGHWIWYVFPQWSGLGQSAMAEAYGVHGAEEASEYLRDPVLRSRLLAITSEVARHLREGASLDALMGSSIDALKLVSSLTLFGDVAKRLSAAGGPHDYESLARAADRVLAAAASQGYPRCAFTLAQLDHPSRPRV